MSTPRAATEPDLSSLGNLIPAWRLSLRAANKSPKTIRTYLDAGNRLNAFLVENGMPADVTKITREHVETFIVHLTETRSASTAATRYRALQQLWRWLLEEGEIQVSPMKNIRTSGMASRRPV